MDLFVDTIVFDEALHCVFQAVELTLLLWHECIANPGFVQVIDEKETVVAQHRTNGCEHLVVFALLQEVAKRGEKIENQVESVIERFTHILAQKANVL